MKTALVTGASGFVGTYLEVELATDHIVVPFDRRHGGDIRDYEEIRSTIDRVNPDLIWHLAGQAFVPESTTDPRRGLEVNTLGTLNLLEAVRRTGSHARMMLAGTSSEYGDQSGRDFIDERTTPEPNEPYGVSKLAAGQLGLAYHRLYGIPIVVTRAFNHTGPGHAARYAIPSFALRVAEFEAGQCAVVQHGNLNVERNYTDVRDMVKAYRLAINLHSGVYNICSERTVSLRSVLDTLIGLAHVEVKTIQSEALYRYGDMDFPEPICAKFKRLTGWSPTISLEQTLEDTLNYWRQRI